jgi:hypothetical protein
MNWLLPITYHVQRAQERRDARIAAGEYLKQFGPRGSKAYQREAKRISRQRRGGEARISR